MHSKYGKDGFAAISVSLDDPNEKGNKEKVVKFLESKKATFTNLILNEKAEDWQAKLKIDGPPAAAENGSRLAQGDQAKPTKPSTSGRQKMPIELRGWKKTRTR